MPIGQFHGTSAKMTPMFHRTPAFALEAHSDLETKGGLQKAVVANLLCMFVNGDFFRLCLTLFKKCRGTLQSMR